MEDQEEEKKNVMLVWAWVKKAYANWGAITLIVGTLVGSATIYLKGVIEDETQEVVPMVMHDMVPKLLSSLRLESDQNRELQTDDFRFLLENAVVEILDTLKEHAKLDQSMLSKQKRMSRELDQFITKFETSNSGLIGDGARFTESDLKIKRLEQMVAEQKAEIAFDKKIDYKFNELKIQLINPINSLKKSSERIEEYTEDLEEKESPPLKKPTWWNNGLRK